MKSGGVRCVLKALLKLTSGTDYSHTHTVSTENVRQTSEYNLNTPPCPEPHCGPRVLCQSLPLESNYFI